MKSLEFDVELQAILRQLTRCESRLHRLQGYETLEFRILSSKHNSHTTAADDLQHAVAAKTTDLIG